MNSPDDKIDYQVKRSHRSTADIIVERDGSILVRVPKSLPDERIEDLIESKRYWIYKSLAEWRDLNSSRVKHDYRGGEGFVYLGRTYRLSLVAGQEKPLLLKNGWFCLQKQLVDQGDIESIKAAFRDYYIKKGQERINQRVIYFAPKVDVQPNGVSVKELGNRWATCSPSGKLGFNWKCMMAPLSIIDYIVVHELCHLRERDHTDAFWNEVDKVQPNFLERKEWLRKNGAGLDL